MIEDTELITGIIYVINNGDEEFIEAFVMWYCQRITKMSFIEKVTNEQVVKIYWSKNVFWGKRKYQEVRYFLKRRRGIPRLSFTTKHLMYI